MVACLSAAYGYKTCGDICFRLVAMESLSQQRHLDGGHSDLGVPLDPSEGRT